MDPKKRLLVPNCNSVRLKRHKADKDVPESSKADCDSQNSSEDHPSLYLTSLPNEVLFCIFKYLSPADVLSLSQLGDKRLVDLGLSLREANFSLCRKSSFEEISVFFCRNRVKMIEKLNFSHNIFLKSCDLAHIVCRCKNISSLSIVQCGVKYHHILNILKKCPKLEELVWDVVEEFDTKKSKYVDHFSMKTIKLFCKGTVALRSVFNIVKNFPKIENVFINYAPDCFLVSPFSGMWIKSLCCIHSNVCLRYTSGIFPHVFRADFSLQSFHQFILGEFEESSERQQDNVVTSHMHDCPPCLQIQSTEKDIALLSSCSSNAYSSLVIQLTPQVVKVSEKLVKCVVVVAGHKLNNLSLEREACDFRQARQLLSSRNSDPPIPVSSEESFMVCDVLDKISLSCKNITVLNMATIHFPVGSPFKALCQLQNLETLCIPTCALFKPSKDEEILSTCLCCGFQKVVTSCPKVQKFCLVGCDEDVDRVTVDDMVPIKDWKELRHLSLCSVIYRSCNFLKKVADCCQKLESFSLLAVSQSTSCIFVNDVIYLLKTAKNLSFIRINEKKFNPVYERFWEAVGEAVNLEGICIITKSDIYVDTDKVINAMKKLKYLHLFHFYSPRATDRFYLDAKKSMQDHGINNIKFEIKPHVSELVNLTRKLHYHPEPQYCCKLLHLSDICM